MIIDTHIHLDDERYREDFDAMMKRAHEAGVSAFIIPGAHPATLDRAVELCEQYADIYFAVGVHPYDMEHIESV
ncbi:MAG: TatD family hydrolase, partial [Sulfuricurvum sp.]|uniref:TatD family hydrolase n=1 Tax=Sulfuricurvum sp. TaxID=2025608 RepID=UPI0025F5EEA7